MCVSPVIEKYLAKVNNRPIGENSPNLVTLARRLGPVNFFAAKVACPPRMPDLFGTTNVPKRKNIPNT
jgi:hypothetical protein